MDLYRWFTVGLVKHLINYNQTFPVRDLLFFCSVVGEIN